MSSAQIERPFLRRPGVTLALRYAAAVVITVAFLFPVYWLFIISFKTPEEIFAYPPVWYPKSIQFENYGVLFKDGDAITVWNSLVLAGVSTVIAMILGTMAAYSLVRFKTGGENLAVWIISQRMMPPIAIVFPVFLVYVFLGWVDSYIGMIILCEIWQWTPFMFLILLAALSNVDKSLTEAAEIDGASYWRVFFKIVLPAIWPVMAIALLIRGLDLVRIFDIIWSLTAGGPGTMTETISIYTYVQGFQQFETSYTSAIAFLVIVLLTVIVTWAIRRMGLAK
jgi:ABC-type glycerol-3-phosphate transport system permease component